MASVGSTIATFQNQPLLPVPSQATAFVPQANAVSGQPVDQNADTVTLIGRAAESQRPNTQTASAQAGETAAFFQAEQQTFRAANGGTNGPDASAPPAPQLPVKISQEGLAAQAQAQQNDGQTGTVQTATGANNPNEAATAAHAQIAAGPAANTPLAELAQLDNTLQELGVNPDSISVFRRMAMLLYANDPAALKILVKDLQGGSSAAAGDAARAEVQLTNGIVQSGAGSNQAVTSLPNGSAAQASSDPSQGTAVNIVQGAQTNAVVQTPSMLTLGGNSQTPTSQPTDNANFLGLQFTFAALETSMLATQQQNQSVGQLISVDA